MKRKHRRKMIIIGTGVISVTAVLIGVSACSSGRRVDFVAKGEEALARTEKRGAEAIAESDEAVDDGLDRFLELFDDFRPETIAENARNLYSDDCYFNDGFVEIEGNQELAEYLERSAEATKSLDVDVEEIVRSDNGVYVRWIMRFTTRHRELSVVTPGISHLRFDPSGSIIYHRDYWDASGALAEFVPFAGSLLRAIRTRI